MARKEQVTCDVCGAQKQETNHWFTLRTTEFGDGTKGISILGGSYPDDEGTDIDLCGEACVLKKVSELISKQ